MYNRFHPNASTCTLWKSFSETGGGWQIHKIDLSHNRIRISKLLTIQVIMMLFAILATYKWAINYVDIIKQHFLTNIIYGILDFIGVLIIHELVHKYLFFISSGGQKP